MTSGITAMPVLNMNICLPACLQKAALARAMFPGRGVEAEAPREGSWLQVEEGKGSGVVCQPVSDPQRMGRTQTCWTSVPMRAALLSFHSFCSAFPRNV